MSESLTTFTERRRAAWEDLDELIRRARGRTDRLSPVEVRRLGHQHRQAVADLAQARRRFPHEAATHHLEDLVRRSRSLVYGNVVRRTSVVEFLTRGYWRRVVERPVFLLVAALFLWVPALALGFWAHAEPQSAAEVAQISPLTSGIAGGDVRDPDTDTITDPVVSTAFASEIFTNNVRVALIAFAGGLSGGVLTIVSLAFNGLVLGVLAGLVVQAGSGEAFWRLVLPHGVLELSLITVAGAAGLRTGWALLRPGHRTRAESLAVEGRAGVEMALGTALLLVPTGIVEGFVTPRGLSLPSAILVGVALGVAYWATVLWRGRAAITTD